jgi:hypothetical protein
MIWKGQVLDQYYCECPGSCSDAGMQRCQQCLTHRTDALDTWSFDRCRSHCSKDYCEKANCKPDVPTPDPAQCEYSFWGSVGMFWAEAISIAMALGCWTVLAVIVGLVMIWRGHHNKNAGLAFGVAVLPIVIYIMTAFFLGQSTRRTSAPPSSKQPGTSDLCPQELFAWRVFLVLCFLSPLLEIFALFLLMDKKTS